MPEEEPKQMLLAPLAALLIRDELGNVTQVIFSFTSARLYQENNRIAELRAYARQAWQQLEHFEAVLDHFDPGVK